MANVKTLVSSFGKYMLQLFQPMELDKALERMIVLTLQSDPIASMLAQNVVVGHSVGVTDQQIVALMRQRTSKEQML